MAKHMKRREFICGGIAAFGIGALGTDAWAEMARHPLVGKVLPKWEKGHFRISVLFNGRGETTFLVFPDGTSLMIDPVGSAVASRPTPPATRGRSPSWWQCCRERCRAERFALRGEASLDTKRGRFVAVVLRNGRSHRFQHDCGNLVWQ